MFTLEIPKVLDAKLKDLYQSKIKEAPSGAKLPIEDWILNLLREMVIQSSAEKTAADLRSELYGKEIA